MAKPDKIVPQRLRKTDERAISEVFGYVLLIGIVVVGLSIIILMTMPSVEGSKDTAQFNHIEQAFTTADSRISKARFSTSIFQETPFQLNNGKIFIEDSIENSYIAVYKYDSATNTPEATILDPIPLGTIRCVTGYGEVAYQDGGVWEKRACPKDAEHPEGYYSVMVSPPDFNYNGETLTLPIMSITGSDSMTASSGSRVMINVQSLSDPVQIYPSGIFTNPVEQGKDIVVVIKSDYYEAWANFINERTKATASYNPDTKIVTARLKTGTPTQSGTINGGLNTKSMETDNDYAPITKFTIHLVKRNPGKDYFISLHPENPPVNPATMPYLVIKTDRIKGPGKEHVVLYIKYTDTPNGIYETFATKLQFDESTEFTTMDIDMLDPTINVYYGADDDGTGFDSNANPYSVTWGTNPTIKDTGTFIGIENGDDVSSGDSKTLADVTQHYMRLMATKYPTYGPVYGAYGSDNGQNKGKIHYAIDTSTFLLQYNSKQDLKYLYVTQGQIDASLSSSR